MEPILTLDLTEGVFWPGPSNHSSERGFPPSHPIHGFRYHRSCSTTSERGKTFSAPGSLRSCRAAAASRNRSNRDPSAERLVVTLFHNEVTSVNLLFRDLSSDRRFRLSHFRPSGDDGIVPPLSTGGHASRFTSCPWARAVTPFRRVTTVLRNDHAGYP